MTNISQEVSKLQQIEQSGRKIKIYFAGGWFSPEAEERHTRVFNALNETGKFEIFNPKTVSLIVPGSTHDHMIQTLLGNIKGINEADIVVALSDKPYDSGTIWETGYAYGKTPVVYYAENLGDKPFNLMLAKTGKFAPNVERLLEVLEEEDTYELVEFVNDFDGEVE